MVILISMYGLFNSTGSIADFIASVLPDGQQQIYMSESCVVCRSLFVCLLYIQSIHTWSKPQDIEFVIINYVC